MEAAPVQQTTLNGPSLELSVAELLSAAFARPLLLLAALFVPPLIALLLLAVLPPTYRAHTALMVKTGREYLAASPTGGTESAPTITKLEEINSEVELLQNRAVIEQTINTIGLQQLFPSIEANPPHRSSKMDAAVEQFRSALDVSPVKMSNVIDVTFDYANDPSMASRVLDVYVGAYLTRHAAVFAGGQTRSFTQSLEADAAELRRLQERQATIKLDSRIYDIADQRGALITQRVDAEAHLQDTADRQATLTQRIAYLASLGGHVLSTSTSTESAPSDERVHANETLIDLNQTEASLTARYAPDNPDLMRVREQIAALQKQNTAMQSKSVRVSTAPTQLPEQIAHDLVMDRAELAPLHQEAERYQTLITQLNNELRRLEHADVDLRTVQTQIDTLSDNAKSMRALYDVARTEDAMDQERLASVVQVSPAMTPLKPASPMRLLFLAGGVLAGLIAAGAVAVFRMVARQVVYTPQGLAADLGLPVLGQLDLLKAA